jgi:hypothetical protein
MSLLSTDITKGKKLSLLEVKLPNQERRRVEPIVKVERPPSDEEVAYSKMIAKNPLLGKLVEGLDLVSIKTGDRIREVVSTTTVKPQEGDRSKLIALANKIINPEKSYSKTAILDNLKATTNINQERAEKGFKMMLQAGAIEQTINPELYFLGGSTPF